MDFDSISLELGVEPPTWIRSEQYSAFQRDLSSAIDKGKKINFPSDEIFWLSFQKSNIDFSKFGFRQFGWREHTKLERTNIKDDEIVYAVWDAFESSASVFVSDMSARW